ncbi:hypothetical protein SAMN05444679_103127 [Variovorax sp. CF079]|uniref:hypothetical protein n=1 Tax=Variovorax sp. CF079 TaxID=1882774 RepID=UPI0008886754|nr:hypothetical protein [Variovorax sp. CF079]SDC46080.1 hypothetical protein SAMN05444679_103127 [Variovorax sp. CF079]
MSGADRSSPLKPVFAALSRHVEVVEVALRELVGVDQPEAHADPAVRSLREFQVLRPAGERGYRLHSRLREFANDVLQIHPAYQSLTGIGQLVEHIPMVWNELDDLRLAGDHRQADEAAAQIEQDAFDIADMVERNLRLLGLLLSTRFGNVASLAAKSSQNRYYQRQSEGMSNDLARLTRAVEKVEGEARERGMQAVAAMLRNTLQSQLPRWTQTLSQFQSQIRRELFSMREIERKNVLLARTAMLLRQNPAWRGPENPMLGEEIAPLLLSKPFIGPSLPPVQFHMDPQDDDRAMIDLMRDEVRLLPALPAAAPEPNENAPRLKRMAPKQPHEEGLDMPAMVALARLARAAIARAGLAYRAAPLSVLEWRASDDAARTMDANLWLSFTASALRTYKFRVVLVTEAPAPGERFRHSFCDALVAPTSEAIALFGRTLGRHLGAAARADASAPALTSTAQ